MKTIKLKSKSGIRGKYKITVFKAGTREVLRESDWIENLVVKNSNNGVNIIIKRLLGTLTNDIVVTKAKIGDDNTAAVDADTDLGNTILDNISIATKVETDLNVVTFVFFMTDSELNDDTYEEFGIFCTDQLFARSIISPAHVKASGEDTQVTYTITIANS